MDHAAAKVVRLTPEQEQARKAEADRVLNEKHTRLRKIRYEQYLKLKAEFDELPPGDIEKLRTRTDLVAEADQGARNLGVGVALSFKRLALMAREKLSRLRAVFGYALAKRYALRHGLAALLMLGGAFNVECVGSNGLTKWVTGLEFNMVTTVGLNHVLDVVFHADTPNTVWYIGLVQGSSTPTYAAGDTMGSHAGWTEYTAYSQTNRVTWAEGAASSGSTTNATTSDFSMNASGTVAGMFLTSVSTKSGTTGVLFATANFSGGNQAVSNGDTLKVTYTINATAS